jgi:subtilisin family serine protease
MKGSMRLRVLGAGTLLTLAAGPLFAQPEPASPDAVLDAVKQSPTASRIGPILQHLYDEHVAARSAAGGATTQALTDKRKAVRVGDGMVGIDAMATDGPALVRSLQALGAKKVRAVGPLVSARVPIGAIGQLAQDRALAYARPVMATTDALPKKVISQGVSSMRVQAARKQANVDGTGIMVGTLSDSFACHPGPFIAGAPTSTRSEDISNDELPRRVLVLSEGPCADGIDEGRAMAQLVHDVAPGASIAFHTAFNSELDFAEGIIDLQEAGADVIVDDVRYFAEPFFSDGMIAQAVDIVTSRGVPYFSSAGNQARSSYESKFRGVNRATGQNTPKRRFHDFNPGSGVQVLQPIALFPDNGVADVVFTFQWDQPHRTATTYAWIKAGASVGEAAARSRGATSDLDIVVFDAKGQPIRPCPAQLPAVITCQVTGDANIGRDAVDLAEVIYLGPPRDQVTLYVGLVVSGGPDPGVVKYNWFEFAGGFAPLKFDTASGTSFGHSNARSNVAVGAASWYATVPYSTSGTIPPNDRHFKPRIDLSRCKPACLNDFSSAGRIPIYLDRFGNRLAKPEIRRTPSVTGPDGGNTTFFLTDSSYDDDDRDGINSPTSTFITPQLDRPGDEFPNFFGTSASAPHVAGVAALMLDKNPRGSPAYIKQVLEQSARPMHLRFISNRPIITFPVNEVGPRGYDFDSGFGLVNAAAALRTYAPK